MNNWLIAAVSLLLALITIRMGCRYRTIPWPWWLAWWLENPYMKWVNPKHVLVSLLKLEPGMKVLDVGCGAGRISLPVAKAIGADGAVDAVDMQKRMLLQLRRHAQQRQIKNITPRQLDLQTELKDLPDTYYDRILLTTVLGEVPDQISLLKALKARLKPDGMLVVTEILPDPCFVTRRHLRQLADSCGFKSTTLLTTRLQYSVALHS